MVSIRMSDDEVAMLKALAEASGLSASDIVRTMVREAHKRLRTRGKR